MPLPGGELSLLVLLGDADLAPALLGERTAAVEVVEEVARGGHGPKVQRGAGIGREVRGPAGADLEGPG